jgi:polysaccharide pyruvyl transferase WcaK-like protein
MKKIGIYTLYNSKNFGAFLQAFALMKFLEEHNNCKVYFIKNNENKSKINLFDYKKIKKNFYYLIQDYKFKRTYKHFKIIEKNDAIYNEIDSILFGSDEIWNVKNKYFNHIDDFFGVDDKKSISYACSCNESTYDDIFKMYGLGAFDKFDLISVRDDNTLDVVNKFGKVNAKKVLDPTFLISYDKYLKKVKLKNYILVYGYHFTESEINKIKAFATKRNLKTISMGQYQSWCDKNLHGDAFDFLSYVKNSDYFITSTFHGCVFAVIFKKNFGVFVNENIKVKEFVKNMNLKDFVIDNIDDLSKTLDKKVNITPDIVNSKNFIDNSIKE